jgi:DedD protein
LSNPREQSYYEIALTNRQVMTIFVVLLVCVLAAFVGGVWVGRGSEFSVTTAVAQEIDSGVHAGEPPLEELDFFSDPGTSDTEAVAAEEQTPARSGTDSAQPVILEDIGRRRGQAQPQDAQPGSQTPAPSPGQEPTQGPAQAPIRDASQTASAGAAVAAEALVVQVFSSTDLQQAGRVVERVRSGGYPAVLSSVDVGGRVTYRVRVGPYSDREEAQGVADRIRRAYKLDTWITR